MPRIVLSRRIEVLEDRSVPAVAFALSSNSLVPFDTANPAAALAPVAVAGLAAGDNLVGIDFRPQNSMLYGLGYNSVASTATLYAISPRTGAAAAVGAPIGGATGTNFGFDFNPTVDRIRVVTDSGQNYRINPNTGAVVLGDSLLNGAVSALDGSAYTNDLPNSSVTTLYGLNAASDVLVIQSDPNGGVTSSPVGVTLNGAPLNFTAANGFDIPAGVNVAASNTPATGAGFAALTVGGVTRLYTIDLTSGAASDLGPIGAGGAVQGLAVWNDLAQEGPAINLAADGLTLRRYAQQQPPVAVGVTGVAAGETLSDIAWRPATGQFYGLGVNPGSGAGTLYLIDPQTGAATVVGAVGGVTPSSPLPPVSVGYGFSFNPTVDRIRVTTGTGLDFRINPNTGAVAFNDPAINGGATGAVSAAYTNGYNGTAVTTLYTLDAVGNTLSIQNPPNSGTQTATLPVTLNGAALDFTEVNGFAIPPGVSVGASNAAAAGKGIAVLSVGGVQNFYQIDLTTGAATLIPAFQTIPPIISLALADDPPGAVGFNLPPGAPTRFVGGTTVSIPLTRTDGNVGAVTVNVSATGGTAVAGVDYNGLPATVTFADGQTTATLTFTLPAGAASTGDKTLVLGLSAPTGGAVLGLGTTLNLTVARRVAPTRQFAVGQDVGGGTVTVYNPDQTVRFGLPAFGVGYTLGVRTAMADVNGDGVPDLIVGTGPGVASRVRVLDGVTQAELFSVQPFEATFTGGVFVAAGDIDGDGKAEIVVTPDQSGGPRVLIYKGGTFTQVANFFGIDDPNFRGGARAAVADVNGDGFGDLIIAAGFGGGPRVAVFNGTTVLTSAAPTRLLPDFFAFEDTLRNGVYVSGGDVNGDGKADIVTGAGPGGGPRVQIIDGAVALANGGVNVVPTANPANVVLANFFAGDQNNRGGIRVAAKDLDGDGFADLVTGSGQGAGSQTTGYLGSNLRVGNATQSFAFDAFPGFTGGVYVG